MWGIGAGLKENGSVVSPATCSQISESKVYTSKTPASSSQSVYLSSKAVWIHACGHIFQLPWFTTFWEQQVTKGSTF